MTEILSLRTAEKIRATLKLNPYEFSVRLGYSPTAYPYALKVKKLSRWMQREIAVRYGRVLTEKGRQCTTTT